MIKLEDFTGFKAGGIVSLSSSEVIEDFNQISVDFEIKDVRHYYEPNGSLDYTGYLLHSHLDAELMYMLLSLWPTGPTKSITQACLSNGYKIPNPATFIDNCSN